MKSILLRAGFFAALYAAITSTVQVIFTGTILPTYILVPSVMMGLFSLFHSLLEDTDLINRSIVNTKK